MNRDTFLKQAERHLREINVPYQIGKNTDISISATLKKQREDNDDPAVLLYFALLFLNSEKNTVYAYEKAMEGDKDISSSPEFAQTAVKTGDDKDPVISIGSILGGIASIAASLGLSFEKTDNAREASYPPGYIPPKDSSDEAAAAETVAAAAAMAAAAKAATDPTEPAAETPSTSTPASTTSPTAAAPTAGKGYERPQTKRFCAKCGTKINEGARFCPSCGADSQRPAVGPNAQSIKTQAKTPVPQTRPYASQNAGMKGGKAKRKTPVGTIALVSVLVVGAIIGVAVLGKNFLGKKPDPTTASNATTTTAAALPTVLTNSAIVSAGVDMSDLGNITNGQYYFATDKKVFYSDYDTNDTAHIYSANKDGTGLKTIFDGFGWSLVVFDDWLYFSGNQGKEIDGTYNIFRVKLDGSQLQKLNNEYSYGMFFYNNYLYYMKRNPDYQDKMSICRSSLDGKNEEVLFPFGNSPLVFENQLYYFDNQGNMFRTKPDGKDPQVLLTAAVKAYVLSDEKIVYVDYNNSINTCDLDGKNNKTVVSSNTLPILNVNAYDGRIYYSEYEEDFDYTAYGWNYTIKSCKMDGSDKKSVFSGVSYGIYMNLVNNKLMLMDYVRDPSSQIMNAVIKVMNLDGSNQSTLAR